MHKAVLLFSVAVSVNLCLFTGISVEAQSFHASARRNDPRISVRRFLTSTGIYTGASIDPVTKYGTFTITRSDTERGLIKTTYAVTPNTKFLRRHGGQILFNDIKTEEEVTIYSERNANGSHTALTIRDNHVWLLDVALSKAEILTLDTEKNTATVKDLLTDNVLTLFYTSSTLIQDAEAQVVKEDALQEGTTVRVRGVVRKTANELIIEQALILWILPEKP